MHKEAYFLRTKNAIWSYFNFCTIMLFEFLYHFNIFFEYQNRIIVPLFWFFFFKKQLQIIVPFW